MIMKNKSPIFLLHYIRKRNFIAHGQGFLVIPEGYVPEFKKKLISFYEGENISTISKFLKKNIVVPEFLYSITI